MKTLLTTIAVISLIWESSNAFPRRIHYANESTLELVHVLYRHGDRTPEEKNLYPSNPYYAESNYYPYGYGQLTNEGKMREFKLGTALKQRYRHFLGNVWSINALDVRSTDYNRTKMSAQLMTAGLWPPSCFNIWNSVLHWQPIPYNYEKIVDDKELSPFIGCSTFDALVTEVLESPEVGNYVAARYGETFSILARRTGLEITYLKAFLLYFGLAIQEELNLPLEDWVSSVYPEPLHSLSIDFYYIKTNTTKLRRIISGYLLKKIVTDTRNKIDGTSSPAGQKMFIYSAHETNIAALLLSLDAYKLVEIPPYGSYMLVEVHNIDGVHGIKLFYQDFTHEDPEPLQIPGCDEFCPFDEFVSLVEEILPHSDEECYGSSKKLKIE